MPRVKSTPVRRLTHRFESATLSTHDHDDHEGFPEEEDQDYELNRQNNTESTSSMPVVHAKSFTLPLDLPSDWVNIDCPSDLQDKLFEFEYSCTIDIPGENFFFLASVAVPVVMEGVNIDDAESKCVLEIGLSILIVRFNGVQIAHRYPNKALAYLADALRSSRIVITYQRRDIEAGCSLVLHYYSVARLLCCPSSFLFLLDCEAVYPAECESLNFDANRLLSDIEATQRLNTENLYNISNVAEKLSRLGVLTKLRPYQLDGVKWMLHRLNVDFIFVNTMSYMHIIPPSSTVGFHFSAYYGCLLHFPATSSLNSTLEGFILADEMGLGK
ncbi:hypothetical protein EON65_05725 [archaeon]|nr:MAG: hypothetical protein EON65_05725 [archaeon]